MTVTSTHFPSQAPSVSTIKANPGFIPAASAISNEIARRKLQKRGNHRENADAHASRHPALIKCTTYHGVTTTAHDGPQPTTTVTKVGKAKTVYTSGTVTEHETFTRKTTNTVATTDVHTNSITKTQVVTVTSVISATGTQSATATAAPAVSYYYEACGPDNLLNYTILANSTTQVPIVNFSFTPGTSRVSLAKSAYACCVACITSEQCTGSYYRSGYCFYRGVSSCKAQSSTPFGKIRYGEGAASEVTYGYTVSNGNCGVWGYGGA